ncbi:MAG TPA: hypothetical protein VK623_01985 [Flavobacterium sp.]|nr:hypothetical protein [Flavobacterium sp.]
MQRVIFLFLLLCSTVILAQETPAPAPPKNNFEAGFDGMLGISYGSETLGINVGGPSLKYKFTKNFKVGAGCFPSLIVMDKKALPRLAVSPIIEYKRWMFITPYYGYDAKDKQIWTFGLGYKFI